MIQKKVIYYFLLITLVVVLVGSSVFLQDLVSKYIVTLSGFEKQNPILAVGLFVLLACLSVLLGPFSSFPLIPPGVVVWGPMLTFIFLMSGWLIGNLTAYAIGRYFGLFLVNKIIGERKVNKWLDTLNAHLNFFILLLFRLATPSETGYVFGLIRYNFAKYALISFLAELPFGLILVLGSDALVATSWQQLLALGWTWAAIIIIAFVIFRRKTSKTI